MQRFVVWDVDDVLFHTAHLAATKMQQGGYPCSPSSEWSHYNWCDHIGLGWRFDGPEIKEWMISSRIIEDSQPFEYTKQALQLTYDAGYHNVLLTARGWHPDGWSLTHAALQQAHLDRLVQRLLVVSPSQCKTAVMTDLIRIPEIALFVEDSASNGLKAHAAGIPVACVKTSWNKSASFPTDDPTFTLIETALDAARLLPICRVE